MEQLNPQITDDIKEVKSAKNKKNWKTVIGLVVTICIVITASILYIKLYKIPHDEAVNNFNNSVNQFNVEKANLEKRNQELDDRIFSLGQVIYADDIPIDEFLLSEAKSILEEARNIPKDSAPSLPKMPQKIEEINIEASNILTLATDVQMMGDYSDTLELLSTTETKYQTMIENFSTCTTNVEWVGVDTERTILRFVVKIINPNSYTLRDVTTEWVAYDKNDFIVGSYEIFQPDIPANSYIYYVGGAGGANLSGTPVRIEMNIKSEGLLTNREIPVISVSNVNIKNNGFNWFTVSADCITDSDISTTNIDGQVIVKNSNGEIIGADFWSADNLPDSVNANAKFIVSEDFFGLPAVPKDAEIYMYYILR